MFFMFFYLQINVFIIYGEMWSGWSSAEGTRMDAPKAPTGVRSGEGVSPSPVGWGLGRAPRKILACSPSKWCILMHSGARLGQLLLRLRCS